jgi:hypothetical protein
MHINYFIYLLFYIKEDWGIYWSLEMNTNFWKKYLSYSKKKWFTIANQNTSWSFINNENTKNKSIFYSENSNYDKISENPIFYIDNNNKLQYSDNNTILNKLIVYSIEWKTFKNISFIAEKDNYSKTNIDYCIFLNNEQKEIFKNNLTIIDESLSLIKLSHSLKK